MNGEFRCLPCDAGWSIQFDAFAGPCEILVETLAEVVVLDIAREVQRETHRIEATYSRYRKDSALSRVNAGAGLYGVEVNEEFAALLDFAKQCFDGSAGLFDITAGSLRHLWTFDGMEQTLPTSRRIAEALEGVGFEKLHWREAGPKDSHIQLDEGVQIDFGGIAKEYAVDRVIALLQEFGADHALVNFGGDLGVTGPRGNGEAWRVGLEKASTPGQPPEGGDLIYLQAGAIATSGDSKRYFLHGGQRLGHILDPRTALPVRGAPASVSVAASSCLMAGMLSTIAMLKGEGASDYLSRSGHHFWIQENQDFAPSGSMT